MTYMHALEFALLFWVMGLGTGYLLRKVLTFKPASVPSDTDPGAPKGIGWHFHDWTTWKTTEVEMTGILQPDGWDELVQYRVCLRCSKLKIRRL